ncbi:putative protein kinase [Gregarina niphandrodes]|uniref:non-specific serine/threonine protein kinase n=1 Tax=Gregarina niphandrodes TaxID=110365 RepID=A0A023B5Y4_GRENI|nr:putative protein kinase [Gregarina niphandrodes]EZG64223.1 putative protein kinase [Gregarina niphandrodes]|eukprot:XP_011130648.1 putative protein kinase [Gregarina niphandrodes]
MAVFRLNALYSSYDVVHGHIKPSNLYVSSNGGSLILGDFLPISYVYRLLENDVIDKVYMSPELFKMRKTDKLLTEDIVSKDVLHKHDLFCLGLSLYYICMKVAPDSKLHRSKQVHGETLLRFATERSELTHLVKQCLSWNPDERPHHANALSAAVSKMFNFSWLQG